MLSEKANTTNFRNNYIVWQMTHETSHNTQVTYAKHYTTEPQDNPLWGPSTLTRMTWSHKTILCIQVVKVTLTLRSNETNNVYKFLVFVYCWYSILLYLKSRLLSRQISNISSCYTFDLRQRLSWWYLSYLPLHCPWLTPPLLFPFFDISSLAGS
jgi:hypothetical protein